MAEPDFSDYSDAELEAIATGDEFADFSDEELMTIAGEQEPEQPVSGFRDFFTGENRTTEQLDALPELFGASGVMAGEDKLQMLKLMPAIVTATDPNEIAQIVSENFPHIGTTSTQDAQGNPVPILVNNKTGNAGVVNKPGASLTDAINFGSLAALFSPAAGAAGVGRAAVASGLTGAGIQGAQEASGGEFSGSEVALDAALGGVGKAAETAIGAGYRALKGDAPLNNLVEAGRDTDIRVLTSDINPPDTFAGNTLRETAEKIPFAGTGPVRAAQQEQRVAAVDRVIADYGLPDYSDIVESLKTKKGKIKSAAGSVIGKTGDDLDPIGPVELRNTTELIEEAQAELTAPGIIQSSKALTDLAELTETLKTPQTFTMLTKNRTAFREIVESVDPTGRSQLPSRAKGLLTKIQSAIGNDLERHAKANLEPERFAKWKRANAVYANEAKELKRSKLKGVLDKGDISPEQAKTMLFSSKPSEIQLLYNGLGRAGRANGRSAVIHEIASALSRRSSGITPNAFLTEMKKNQATINVFFKGEEKKRLMGLGKVLEATKRAQDAKVTTPTGQTLLSVAGVGGAIANLPATLASASSLGFLSRLYESPAVRSALLRLGSTPPRSTRFEKALLGAQSALTTALQATASVEELQRQ